MTMRELLCHGTTEKTAKVLEQAGIDTGEKKSKPADEAPAGAGAPPVRSAAAGHGRNSAAALSRGGQGPSSTRMGQRDPGVLVRIQGQAPIAATVHELEKRSR